MIPENVNKIIKLIQRRGIRKGVDIALESWLRNRPAFNSHVLDGFSFITLPTRPACLAVSNDAPIRIGWVLEPFGKNQGGITTILRTIHQLEQWGYAQRIYVTPNDALRSDGIRELITRHYFPLRCVVEVLADSISDCDALVATSWKTAYYVRSIPNTARKFYFVQDLEDRFFADGSVREFARETYRFGFYGITAGSWIAEQLRSNYDMPATSFGFSFDRTIYTKEGTTAFHDDRKRVLFYARPSTERRGFELGLLALSIVARQLPDTEFILLGYQGDVKNLSFRALASGLLAPHRLAELYRSCEAALCLSLTNLSLLPLELMATGCPVISNSGPNVEWLLNESVAELTRTTPEALADGILRTMQDPRLRGRRISAGATLAFSTTWEEQMRSIERGFLDGLGVHRWSH
jgi:glycosyltransferase involved in cell wall biosynthesis